MRISGAAIIAALSVLVFPAFGSSTAAETDEQSSRSIEIIGLKAELPTAWVEQQPSSSMRVAQYLVPGENEDEYAEFIVFYFGPGQGGSVNDNIARWQSQFSTTEGTLVTPAVETLVVHGMPATIAEFNGNYARAVGMGHGGAGTPGQTLIAAIVETPHGNLNIQLHGPTSVVSAHREAYLSFIKSMRGQSEI